MATFTKFNATVANMANGAVNLGADALKIMLTNTAPSATNSFYADVSGTELASGTGYTTGGLTIGTTSSTQTAGLYKLILAAASATLTATGAVSPFRYAILYDTVGAKCL